MKKIISVLIIVAMLLSFATIGFAETVKPGDVNGDGSITASDARKILRISAQLDSSDAQTQIIADVNGDGQITASDARKVLRISALLESELPEITVGGGQEISDGIGTALSKFIIKYGPFEIVGTSDGTKTYRNDEITVVSDPEMISDDKISSITVTGNGYTVNGLSVGMDTDTAKSQLVNERWTLKATNDVLVSYSKDGLLIKLVSVDGVVAKITICLAHSLVNDGSNDDESPDDDVTVDDDGIPMEQLPEAAQYFLNGQFGIDGSINADGSATEISLYTDSVNINIRALMDMGEDGIVDISILILDEGDKDRNIYMLNNDDKRYCELNDSTLAVINGFTNGVLNISKNDFEFDFNLNDTSTLTITAEERNENGVNYTVYRAKGERNITNLYMDKDELVKVITTDFYGNVITTIEIDEFRYPLPENCFSYSEYKKTGIMSLFDFEMF